MSSSGLSLLKASLVSAVVSVSLIAQVSADETPAKSDTPTRETVRDQRPDSSRGWIIVTKQSFWPLCYESLDRIEEARKLIGSKDNQKLAQALDKCGAWLKLAASAAMTDGTAGVEDAGFAFEDAAESVLSGSSDWSDTELTDLTTYGLVLMAKSHVLRADAPDREYSAQRTANKPKTEKPSKELVALEKEIAAENIAYTVAQYDYDAMESLRHLTVAQTYLKAAAEAGKFNLDPALTESVPNYDAAEWSSKNEYVQDELRPRITAITEFINGQQAVIYRKLSDKF